MRTLLLLLLLPACAPLTPEGRAYMAAHLQQQAQRDHEWRMHSSAVSQGYVQRAMPARRVYAPQYPTYYARPDQLWPGGTVISPNRY